MEILSTQPSGVHFETIFKQVSQHFSNFYTKEFLFTIIDELSQQSLLCEMRKLVYS